MSSLGTSPPGAADVVVVGAGLAGLAAAVACQRSGRSVVVLEASDGVGGRVRTDIVDGFRLDRGFQILLTSYPELETQLDVDALDLRRFDPGALVWDGQRLSRVSDPLRRPQDLWSTASAPLGSLLDKARLARLGLRLRRTDAPALLRGDDVSTRAALDAEGFGPEMVERFLRPLVGGIQLDGELATSRRMFDTIFRALAIGDAAVPAAGMQAVPEQLAGQLRPDTVWLGQPVAEVGGGRVTLRSGAQISATAVVVATDGPAAAELLGLEARPSRPASAVWFSAPSAPIDDAAIVLDGVSDGPVRNIAVMTNVAPEYRVDPSTDHEALVVAAIPGREAPDAATDAADQLRGLWGSQVDAWRVLRTDVIPHGQPDQSPPFSPKRRVALGDGLFVCGDHRDTASIQGALFSGRRCAEAVLSSLEARSER
ncbi:MAG: NAD(P)/FAD-dependent oxidoreductase [Acidimicrobiales bacterium]